MTIKKTNAERILKLAKKLEFIQVRDLRAAGLHPEYLRRLVNAGKLVRDGRGLYRLQGGKISEKHSLAEAAKRVPNCVICLLSALRFHDFTTQLPREVWIAIDVKARAPKQSGVSLRVVRSSGDALTKGIEEHIVEGVKIKVYCAAKTVADCFKFRNKVGLDVAVEALRECRRGRLATLAEIQTYAKICRVANVMRPYIEMLI